MSLGDGRMEIILVDLDTVIAKGRMDFDFYNPNQTKITDSMVKGYSKDKLDSICISIHTGKTASRNSYPEQGIRIIKVKNITGSGVRWGEYFYVTEKFYEDAKKKSHVQIGDILMLCSAHSKVYIGRCDIIDHFPEDIVTNDSKLCCVGELIIIRANPEKVIPQYLLTFLRLPIVQDQIKLMVKGQSAHLYSKDLKNLDVVIPPRDIQEKIAEISTVSQKEYLNRIKEAKEALNKAIEQISNIIISGKSK